MLIETKIKNYGRGVDLTRRDYDDTRCDKCEILGPVLAIDGSGGEYALLQICGNCLRKVLKSENL